VSRSGTSILYSPFTLVLAAGASALGDVLLSFLWNAKLIPYNPTLGLSSLGILSAIGITLGLTLAPYVTRLRNQAYFLAAGSALRALAVLALALAASAGDTSLLPFAGLVQVMDMMVAVLTAGAVNAILAEHFPKEMFVQVSGFNQVVGRTAVLSGWLLGGVLVALFSTVGLIWVDFVSFIPITVLLLVWARRTQGVAMLKSTQSEPQRDTVGDSAALLTTVLPYGIVFVLGSLVSRTTPLLWQASFPASTWSYDISQGVLFATFVAGHLTAGLIVASKRGSQIFRTLLSRDYGLVLVTIFFGLSISILPLGKAHPLVMGVLLLASGLFSGFVPTAFLTTARTKHEGLLLRRVFHLMGLVGRFGEPAGGAIAGALLVWLSIPSLYAVSGIGIIVVATLLFAVGLLRTRARIGGNLIG